MAEKMLAKAGRDTTEMEEEDVTRIVCSNTTSLTNDYSDLQEAQQALVKGSEVEIRRLMDELAGCSEGSAKTGKRAE